MTAARIPAAPSLLLLLLLSFAPAGGAAAQHLRSVVVPDDAEVVIAARGAPQPRLAPRPVTAARRSVPLPGQSSPFTAAGAEPLAAAGPAILPLAAAAALAAALGGGRGSGSAAPVRTR